MKSLILQTLFAMTIALALVVCSASLGAEADNSELPYKINECDQICFQAGPVKQRHGWYGSTIQQQ